LVVTTVSLTFSLNFHAFDVRLLNA